MAIEGPLKELSIHDVFQLLDLSRKTGLLTVTSKLRHNAGTVYFDGGAVVYAAIQDNPHPLGELLLRTGKITDADLNRARDMQEGGDTRLLGEVLVEIGAIGRGELERQVRFQVEEVIFEVMNWSEGYFTFEEGPLQGVPADATVRITTESVLMEGARRIDEWSRIERKIPNVEVVPTLAPAQQGEPGGLDLLPAEWEILATIDGECDIRTIASLIGRSEFDVAKTLFGLESAGLITVTEAGPTTRVAPEAADTDGMLERAHAVLEAGDYTTATELAEAARERFPHDPVVYLLLGRLDLQRRRPADAEEHLRRALRLDPLLGPAHLQLGHSLALQGRLSEAIEWWQRWLTIGEQADGDPGEIQQVREALQAARTLSSFLRGVHG
jgi:hypothetical protein